ncbi:DUF6879 family protein [Streptomyces sp. Rer75]|uniref:DUF6879 family protein n=1 Tax=Streptomyces sp. Rer75 TaxID=2750011 RepID=UPI0015D04F13|nr:DUF6879 family protein [Streptomyces sp. Rer75]QLH22046.1 hypothetical protein HYQ63_16695 [Streptomyces sp. Rer75]
MRDLQAPALPPDQGERLTRDAYKRDFRECEATIRDAASWKLERRQHFEEQGSPSRDALRRGQWEEALRLLEDRRDALRAAEEEDTQRGHTFHRVRVVETPLTPYMQWELHSHRQRAEYGERIRVTDAVQTASAETAGPLPEIVVLGGSVLFQVLYDDAGCCIGASRHTDHGTVSNWASYLEKLFTAGEDIASYFTREVAPLPPPRLRRD